MISHSHPLPPPATADGLDLPAHEAELEAMAEGAATTTTTATPYDDTDYIERTLAKLDHHHHTGASSLMADNVPAQHAHPSISVHGVHGCDPERQTRAEIEAKLEQMDQARKLEKRRLELAARTNSSTTPLQSPSKSISSTASEAEDAAILKILAMRKLQLLQQHLKTDNQPVLVRPATATHGNLYLGSVGASHHLPNLIAHNITHILSVGRNLSQPFPSHFNYLYIPMLDSSTTKITQDVYETSWNFIEEARTGTRSSTPPGGIKTASIAQVPSGNTTTTMKSSPSSSTTTTLTITSNQIVARSSAGTATNQLRHDVNQTMKEEGAVHTAANITAASVAAAAAMANASPTATTARPGNVLVHCFAGKSRSTTILLSYLMYSEKWSLDEAYAHVKNCRPTINPNPGFLLQLKDLEKQLFGTNAPASSTTPTTTTSTTTTPMNTQ